MNPIRHEGLGPADLDRVRRVLWLNGLRGADLDDATQEVRLRFLERAPAGLSSPAAWACTVATNVALDHHRKARRHHDTAVRLHAVPPPVTDTDDLALAEAVAGALERLDPDLRAVVVLRFYADLPIAAIAAELGVPEGTVKSRLHRAVSELRAALPQEAIE